MAMGGSMRGYVLAFVVILSATRLVSFMVVTRLKYLFLAPLLLVMGGCGYDRFDALSEPDETAPHANTTLASVRSYYERGEVDMPEGVVVGGRVTTSDSAGNFYKMIVIQQGDASLAVLTGTYDTYSAYRPGERVVVRLDGLRLGLWDGMLAVGAPEPDYPKGIDYISSDVVLRQMMFRSEEPMPEIDTLEVTIPEVTEALAGRLVRVVDGSFTQGGRHTWSGASSGGWSTDGSNPGTPGSSEPSGPERTPTCARSYATTPTWEGGSPRWTLTASAPGSPSGTTGGTGPTRTST